MALILAVVDLCSLHVDNIHLSKDIDPTGSCWIVSNIVDIGLCNRDHGWDATSNKPFGNHKLQHSKLTEPNLFKY